MKIYEATLFDSTRHELGEAPFYDPRTQKYIWVDIIGNKVYTLDKDGNKVVFDMGKTVGAAVPTNDKDALLLAAHDGLYILKDNKVELILDMSNEFKPYQRSNDCKSDPVGRVFFGSSLADDDYEPSGNLYTYDAQNGLRIQQTDTKIANGMAWNKAKTKLYFSDSPYGVFEYDYDVNTGTISNRKLLFTVEEGTTDGMCIDSDDNLWVALWGGHKVECHSSLTGEKLAEINVPATQVTSCCFAGEDLKTLFITTAGVGLDGIYEGALFICEVDATGVNPDYIEI